MDFSKYAAVQRKASPPARAVTLPQGASPHRSGVGWGEAGNRPAHPSENVLGSGALCKGTRRASACGAEWWLGRHPCRPMGSSSATHRHSVWLRGSLLSCLWPPHLAYSLSAFRARPTVTSSWKPAVAASS